MAAQCPCIALQDSMGEAAGSYGVQHLFVQLKGEVVLQCVCVCIIQQLVCVCIIQQLVYHTTTKCVCVCVSYNN